jgi:hypothetical protein
VELSAEARLVRLLADLHDRENSDRTKPSPAEVDEVRAIAVGAPGLAGLVERIHAGSTSWAAVAADPVAEGQLGLDLVGAVMRRATAETIDGEGSTPLQ